ncbi:MAG TPA: peptidylprolyl isomerase [Cyanobacteria bacterium UBA11372]|nr:peptidylprolyl isomerase [Cyanobacteria bacterium UBA11372]
MDSQAFLTINDQPISLTQAIRYLQLSGRLGAFMRDILREYVLEQELKQRDNLNIDPVLIEQAVIDFRLQRQLTDPKRFQEWLASNRMDYPTFHAQVTSGFKLAKLKAEVTAPKLQEFFIERKIFLDRVVLSRIVVAERELAEELRSQIEEGTAFETLARDYSLTEDRIVNGMMGPVSRGTLPDIIRAAIDQASPGELIGPLELEGRWGLFRVEQILLASLEDAQLSEALQNELFELWITEKMQQMMVKLEVI